MIPPFILSAATRLGIKGGVILALLLALGVQTARIEGFLWHDGLKAKIALREAEIAKIEVVQEVAELKAIAARAAAERKYAEKAKEIDLDYRKKIAGSIDRANRYVASNRLRCPSVGSQASGSVATAESGSPGSAEAADQVAVLASDVMICTENTERLRASKAWAEGL